MDVGLGRQRPAFVSNTPKATAVIETSLIQTVLRFFGGLGGTDFMKVAAPSTRRYMPSPAAAGSPADPLAVRR
jgi:hypothetical protein